MADHSTTDTAKTIPILLCEDCAHAYATQARYWDGERMALHVLCLQCHCCRMVTGQTDLYDRMMAAEARAAANESYAKIGRKVQAAFAEGGAHASR